jgi:Mo-dependent nitrogenase C-terminus
MMQAIQDNQASEIAFDLSITSHTILSSEQSALHPPKASFVQTLLNPVLAPVKEHLDRIQITDRDTAHLLCKLIPAQCPFERDINLFGRRIAHIPPMCKLNPLYDQLVGLRFRSLCYLVDVCGETI